MVWRISVLGCDTVLLAEKFSSFSDYCSGCEVSETAGPVKQRHIPGDLLLSKTTTKKLKSFN